jgi:hypothetical protein
MNMCLPTIWYFTYLPLTVQPIILPQPCASTVEASRICIQNLLFSNPLCHVGRLTQEPQQKYVVRTLYLGFYKSFPHATGRLK